MLILSQATLWFSFLFAMFKASAMHLEWKTLRANGRREWVDAADAEAFCLVFAQIMLGMAYFSWKLS